MDNLTVKVELNTKSVKSFIADYFDKSQPATYHPNGRPQCFSSCKRSFTDITRLCQSYFECTEQDVAKVMIDLWEKNIIQCLFCPTTRKPVFFKYSLMWDGDSDTITNSNFNPDNPVNVMNTMNKPLTKGTDGYSFVDIYNLAKSQQ